MHTASRSTGSTEARHQPTRRLRLTAARFCVRGFGRICIIILRSPASPAAVGEPRRYAALRIRQCKTKQSEGTTMKFKISPQMFPIGLFVFGLPLGIWAAPLPFGDNPMTGTSVATQPSLAGSILED